jgi:hypothetical protein
MERNIYRIGKKLFITSDEEIKEGDWLFSSKTNNIFKADSIEYLESHNMIEDFDKSFYINSKYSKKIILTTDQSLDGVQAIDDEFLEWFVNTPSCEFVEVGKLYKNGYGNWYRNDSHFISSETKYKIIIPKEEPKQETLEKIAADLFYTVGPDGIANQDSFIKGAKWQAERMYTEEEVLNLLLDFNNDKPGIFDASEWFEQFKKK